MPPAPPPPRSRRRWFPSVQRGLSPAGTEPSDTTASKEGLKPPGLAPAFPPTAPPGPQLGPAARASRAPRKFLNLPPSSPLGGLCGSCFLSQVYPPLPFPPGQLQLTLQPGSPPCRSPLGSLRPGEGPPAARSLAGAWRLRRGLQAPRPGANACGRFRDPRAPPRTWPLGGAAPRQLPGAMPRPAGAQGYPGPGASGDGPRPPPRGVAREVTTCPKCHFLNVQGRPGRGLLLSGDQDTDPHLMNPM